MSVIPMSYMGNSIGASGLYAPLVAFWLLKTHGFASTFACASAAVLLGSLIALCLSAARTNLPVTTGASGKVPLINRGALFPTMVFLTYTITTAPVGTFLPQLAESRDLGNPGLFFTMNAMTSMVSMAISGPVSDRVGRGAVIVPGLLVVASSMFILTTAHERWLFLAAGVLSGLGFGMIRDDSGGHAGADCGAGAGEGAQLGARDASVGVGPGRIGRGVHLWATGVGNRGRGDFRNRGRRHGAWGHRLRGGQREVFPEGDHAGVRRSAASKSAICRSGDALRRDTSSSNSAISRTALQMALATSSGSAMPSITIHLSGSSRASSR